MSNFFRKTTDLKKSAASWAGYVPSYWGAASLRWKSRIYAGGTPDKSKLEYWENGNIPWLNSGSVNQNVIRKPSALITEEALKKSSTRWVPRGALLVALAGQGKTKGMVARLAIDSTCNQSVAAIVPNWDLNSIFLYYFLQDNYQNIRNLAGGDLRDGLNLEMLASIVCPIPPVQEQRQIATYLNRETANIDKLITKQQKLMKLLQEKRQAVINQAVTKGLDPNVKMKDSGVEWLGEVPEHWILCRVKNLISVLTDYTANGSFADLAENVKYLDSGYSRLVRLTDLRLALTNDEGVYVSEESHAYLNKSSLHGGELLVANVGAYAGFACLMPKIEFPCTLGPNMYLLRFKSHRTTSEFMDFIFGTRYFSEQLKLKSTSTAQPKLNKENVKTCFVCLPSMEEQIHILEYLNLRLKRIDNVIEKSKCSIALLKEHRQALITAAVTGKIDVRGLVTYEEVAALDADPVLETTEEDFESEVEEADYITEEE